MSKRTVSTLVPLGTLTHFPCSIAFPGNCDFLGGLTSRDKENVTSQKMRLPRKFDFLGNLTSYGNLTSWKMWHLDFKVSRISRIFGFHWCLPEKKEFLKNLTSRAGESWLPGKCDFIDNVTSLEFSKYEKNDTLVKILDNNHMKYCCRIFPSCLSLTELGRFLTYGCRVEFDR